MIEEKLPLCTHFEPIGSVGSWQCTANPEIDRTICTISLGTLLVGQSGSLDVVIHVDGNEAIPKDMKELINDVEIHDDRDHRAWDDARTDLLRPLALDETAEPGRLFIPLVMR